MKEKLIPRKIKITSMKVIDRKKLDLLFGGSAPSIFTSFFSDSDQGDKCSIALDTDS